MGEVLGALALVVLGAWLTRSVYRMGVTAGVRLGYGEGHRDAFAEARRLLQKRTAELNDNDEGSTA